MEISDILHARAAGCPDILFMNILLTKRRLRGTVRGRFLDTFESRLPISDMLEK
jgi:hypothetical protein